jgi:phosphoglycolate phosphatase-like HAD superfamily hydrolase
MKWILFDKDGTLIEFDKSWEKIGIRLVDSSKRLSTNLIPIFSQLLSNSIKVPSLSNNIHFIYIQYNG